MKPRLPNSPTKPALLAVLGSLISCIIFVVPWPRMRHSGLLSVSVLVGLAVFACGAILSLKFTSNLRHGVENRDWPDSQIEPLRNHLESPWYTALSIALLIAFMLFEFVFRRRFGGLGWGCFLLGQTLSQLRMAVRRSIPRTPSGPFTGWHNFAAIHSDHWGQR